MKSRRGTVMLAVLVVAAAMLAVWVARDRPTASDIKPAAAEDGTYTVGTIPGAGRDAVKAATSGLPLALTYDYRSLEKGLAEATDWMTDSFAKEFSDTFIKTAGRMAKDKRAVTRAIVRGGGLVSVDDDKAKCMVFVDQLLVSSRASARDKAPLKLTQNRVLVSLVLIGGHWKIDNITPF